MADADIARTDENILQPRPPSLPVIDGHCHMFGQSLASGKGVNILAFIEKWLLATPLANLYYIPVIGPLFKGVEGPMRYLIYAKGDEGKNAEDCLKGIPDNLLFISGKAAVSLLLDLGYTPLSGLVACLELPFEPELSKDKDGYYSFKDEEWVWYSRELFLDTIEALSEIAAKHPGQIWPMVPFDPRRAVSGWKDKKGNYAFNIVQNAIEELGYVGVKLYTRCGWMPLNNQKMHGEEKGRKLDVELKKLYDYATAEDLPIICHTSPTGFPPEGWLVLPSRFVDNNGAGMAPTLNDPLSKEFRDYIGSENSNHWGGRNNDSPARPATRWENINLSVKICCYMWNYCQYIQLAVSPYAWEEVLKKCHNLRLCFAHYGSELSFVYRYADIKKKWETNDKYDDLKKNLMKNPMVASGESFANGLFEKSCVYCAEQYMANSVTSYHTTKVKETIKQIINCDNWKNALQKWRENYKYDWTTKIIQLQEIYPNVYADIAYLTGGPEDFFTDLLSAIAEDAINGQGGLPKDYVPKYKMTDKIIVGTDWYMIEMDKLSSGDFWKRVQEVLKKDLSKTLACFNKWASTNTLDFLNLSPRINALEDFYKVFYKSDWNKERLPKWWRTLRKYYEDKKTKTTQDFAFA